MTRRFVGSEERKERGDDWVKVERENRRENKEDERMVESVVVRWDEEERRERSGDWRWGGGTGRQKRNSPMMVRSYLCVLMLLNKLMFTKRDVIDVTDVTHRFFSYVQRPALWLLMVVQSPGGLDGKIRVGPPELFPLQWYRKKNSFFVLGCRIHNA